LDEFYVESFLAEETLVHGYSAGEKCQRGRRVTQCYLLGSGHGRV
jgi:hypothetical protein